MFKKRRGTNFVYTNFIKITLKLSLFSALKEAVSVIALVMANGAHIFNMFRCNTGARKMQPPTTNSTLRPHMIFGPAASWHITTSSFGRLLLC